MKLRLICVLLFSLILQTENSVFATTVVQLTNSKFESSLVNSISADGNAYSSVAYKNFLYVSSKAGGLKIYNVENKLSPVEIIPEDRTDFQGTMLVSKGAIYCDGTYLYVGFDLPSVIRKFSLSNPQLPILVATFQGKKPHGMVVSGDYLFTANANDRCLVYRNDTLNIINPRNEIAYLARFFIASALSIATNNNVLYIGYSNGVYAFDIKNPELFTPENTWVDLTKPSGKYYLNHKTWAVGKINQIQADGGYLYCNDSDNKKIYKIDISSDSNLTNEKAYSFNSAGRNNSIFIENQIAYVGEYGNASNNKLLVIDTKNEPMLEKTTLNIVDGCQQISKLGNYVYISNNTQVKVVKITEISVEMFANAKIDKPSDITFSGHSYGQIETVLNIYSVDNGNLVDTVALQVNNSEWNYLKTNLMSGKYQIEVSGYISGGTKVVNDITYLEVPELFLTKNEGDIFRFNNLTSQITIHNFTPNQRNVDIVSGVYLNNILIGCKVINKTLDINPVANNVELELSLDEKYIESENEFVLKTFVWDGIHSMYPATKASNSTVSNAEFVSKAECLTEMFYLLGLSPVSYKNRYSDVTGEVGEMLQALYDVGVIYDDGSTTFGINSDITREEFAYNITKCYEMIIKEVPMGEDVFYNDRLDASEYFRESIDYVLKIGAVDLKSNSYYFPKDFVTTAQMAKALNKLSQIFEENGIVLKQMPWRQSPVIFRVTDEVSLGDTLTVFGQGLCEGGVAVWAENSSVTGEMPSADAVELPVVSQDIEGQYLTVLLPGNFNSGISKIWIENEFGIGNGLLINAPRPTWVSVDVGYEGLEIQLIGHNFSPIRIGANGEVKVKLSNNSGEYEAFVTKIEPYSLKFLIPEGITVGDYQISVTNDGVNWSELDSGQRFSIVTKGTDPLGLGVAWEKNYNYTNQLKITDYGANGADFADDTTAIQNTIKALDDLGGGMVIIPEGNFRFSKITLPSYIIIAGDDRENSVLTCTFDYAPEVETIAIKTVAGKSGIMTGYNGFYNLTMKLDDTNPLQKLPEKLSWIGDGWSNYTAVKSNNRKYEGFFYKNVTVDFPMEIENPSFNTLRNYSIIKKYYLFDNCELKGFQAPPGMPVYGDYTKFTNNYMDNTISTTENVGSYSIWENNTIIKHGTTYTLAGVKLQAQGIFIRTNAYCANNIIQSTGGDGESITTDANKQNVLVRGNVVDATFDTVKLVPSYNADGLIEANLSLMFNGTDSWDMSYPCFGEYSILICDGKGLGQYRKIKSTNEDTSTVTIDKPWDIIPDSSSRFSIVAFNENVVMYANRTTDSVVGFQLYGSNLDCVMADNISNNSFAFKAVAVEKRGVGSADSRFWTNYFLNYRNNQCNSVTGINNEINIKANFESKIEPFGYAVYGVNIKGNTISNIQGTGNTGIFVGNVNKSIMPNRNFVKAVAIEKNSMSELNRGIVIGTYETSIYAKSAVSGVVIKDNLYENVAIHNVENQSENIVVIN